MIDKRPFATLGHANHGWLDAHHHFSFGDYRDPERDRWGSIRVWNDDEIAPGAGFPPHPHADMEIITYVREGAISHRDSEGNEGKTRAGDVQVMSAGSGIRHSEYNAEGETCRLFQIWILPAERGGEAGWGAKPFPKETRAGAFTTLASGFAEDEDALRIRTPARVMGATLHAGQTIEHVIGAGRHAYLVPATGAIDANGTRIDARDGAAIDGGTTLRLTALEDSELVLVDAA